MCINVCLCVGVCGVCVRLVPLEACSPEIRITDSLSHCVGAMQKRQELLSTEPSFQSKTVIFKLPTS